MTAASRLAAPAPAGGVEGPLTSRASDGGVSSGGRVSVTGDDTRTVSRPFARPPMAEVLTVIRRVCGIGVTVSCMGGESASET